MGKLAMALLVQYDSQQVWHNVRNRPVARYATFRIPRQEGCAARFS